MVKVITYGSYDMLHYGHIRLLERAKALGDYLIVGVTSDDFDKVRGKVNLQQSLMERVAAVQETGIADQIIIEEYEGQKIDDIQRYNVDIFAIGSDWQGRFDYLNNYCKVVYLSRTEGISSSELRAKQRKTRIGFLGSGESRVLGKYCAECKYANGAEVSGICTTDIEIHEQYDDALAVDSYDELLEISDAVYIISHPIDHYKDIRKAIEAGKHVLVEMPVAVKKKECEELYALADERNVVLLPALKTAYSTAYSRLLLLLKSGKIGKVLSVDATCTRLRSINLKGDEAQNIWNSICAWGPTAMLPVFDILGTQYKQANIASFYLDQARCFDGFTKIDFLFDDAVASIKVGRLGKSEGELVISGTKGYAYVPAPWWKTDYFEIRYEDPTDNRRYFYQLDGEGIRYMLVAFLKGINNRNTIEYVSRDVSNAMSTVIEKCYAGKAEVIL